MLLLSCCCCLADDEPLAGRLLEPLLLPLLPERCVVLESSLAGLLPLGECTTGDGSNFLEAVGDGVRCS